MAGERHGMCESVFKTAGEQQGNGMGTAWERHGMCESALSVSVGLVIQYAMRMCRTIVFVTVRECF
jgi:hypothetical protein